MTAASKLTPKQARFVRAYLETGNGTESARRAGYAGNDETLAAIGSQNLRKPVIAAAIAAADVRDEKRAIARRSELRAFWTSVFRGEVDPGQAQLRDRLKASELLGKSRGMFVEKRELSGPDGGPIPLVNVSIVDAIAGARKTTIADAAGVPTATPDDEDEEIEG